MPNPGSPTLDPRPWIPASGSPTLHSGTPHAPSELAAVWNVSMEELECAAPPPRRNSWIFFRFRARRDSETRGGER